MADEPDRREPYRDDLSRSVPFTLLRADSDERGDGLTIEGYGAVFNSVTEIDSWEGSFEEELLPGAFKKSLRERTPKMQFDHGHHPLLGSLPLGRWNTAEENAKGLRLVGRFTDNWLTQPFRDAIADGAVEGMSFRFSVVREQWFDKDGKKLSDDELLDMLWRGSGDRGPIRRKLLEVKVSEAGPVTWPAYEETSVGVRSRTLTIDLARLREPSQRRALAEAVCAADAAAARDTQTPDSESGAPPEPRSTDALAVEHPPSQGAPLTTDVSAGEHSSDAIPVNPVERAALIKTRYRAITQRNLALSKSSHIEKEGSR